MYQISPETNLSDFLVEMNCANKLIKLGARPPVVRSLCKIGRKISIRIYREVYHCASKQGMLPYDPYWIVRSSVNDIHASIFMGIFHDLSQLNNQQTTHAQAFITAYELYCEVVGNNPGPGRLEACVNKSRLLEINRAWQLIQQFNNSETSLMVCEKCRSRYLALNTVPKPFQQCPICDVWAHKDGRRRWASVKSRRKA